MDAPIRIRNDALAHNVEMSVRMLIIIFAHLVWLGGLALAYNLIYTTGFEAGRKSISSEMDEP